MHSKKLYKRIFDSVCRKYLPKNLRHDDVFIVEFPKSGVTWFSAILANLLSLINSKDLDVTHYNIQQLIPDIHMSRNLNRSLFSYPGYRFIKSHADYAQEYRHIIYLLRNPYSVMLSYYTQEKLRRNFTGSLDEFLKDPKRGIDAYVRHVKSWLMKDITPSRLHLLKFEDLKTDPLKEILLLTENLGLRRADTKLVQQAIDCSSISKMRHDERLYKGKCPAYLSGFINTGKENPDFSKISERATKTISVSAKEIIEAFYPKLKQPSYNGE